MKKIFNPDAWLPAEKPIVQPLPRLPRPNGNTDLEPIEKALRALEIHSTDITSNYTDWRDIGFAFAQEYGEQGRDYFHRVSRFYPGYSAKACDEQYEKCLRSGGSGITIATFYHHLKQAGIDPSQWRSSYHGAWDNPNRSLKPPSHSTSSPPPSTASDWDLDPTNTSEQLPPAEEDEEKENSIEPLPCFPEELYEQLPTLLKKTVEPGTTPQEKDILLLGALTTLSSCLSNLYGIYDGNKVYANLYLFVTAPASTGKGRLTHCKYLVAPIHRALREEVKKQKEDYEAELVEFNMSKNDSKEKPQKPLEKMLFIPANSSTTGMFQLLHDNDCRGLLFETEGDTLSSAFKNDYSNYSDGFRKAFHHESISYFRRTDREYVNLEEPRLSTVLSGTPRQVINLIPTAENGLFSRFMFYSMKLQPNWKDVFAHSLEDGIAAHYLNLGNDFYKFYQKLEKYEPVKITYSPKQKARFNEFFSQVQLLYLNVKSEDYVATVRRMGLISFRLAMVFTALRMMEDGNWSKVRQCEQRDFEASLQIISVLLKHNSRVFSSLPVEKKPSVRANNKERFLDALPHNFNKQDSLKIASDQRLNSRTVERYLDKWVIAGILRREARGNYFKEIKL